MKSGGFVASPPKLVAASCGLGGGPEAGASGAGVIITSALGDAGAGRPEAARLPWDAACEDMAARAEEALGTIPGKAGRSERQMALWMRERSIPAGQRPATKRKQNALPFARQVGGKLGWVGGQWVGGRVWATISSSVVATVRTPGSGQLDVKAALQSSGQRPWLHNPARSRETKHLTQGGAQGGMRRPTHPQTYRTTRAHRWQGGPSLALRA